jgi:hypothetical protein
VKKEKNEKSHTTQTRLIHSYTLKDDDEVEEKQEAEKKNDRMVSV